MSEHERWSDDVAAYLLGALDEDELAVFEAHLSDCDKCRQELRWMEPAARALPETVRPMKAPAGIRAELMKEVRADARATPATSGAERSQTTLRAWLSRLGGGRYGFKPAAALAAVALAVVAVAGFEVGSGGGGDSTNPAQLTTYPGKRPVEGVKAKVISDGERGVVRLADVKQLPDDRVLEAWVVRGGEVEPVRALFVPNDGGRAATTIADMKGVETVMVTREPKGGSRSPTSSPIATVPISS